MPPRSYVIIQKYSDGIEGTTPIFSFAEDVLVGRVVRRAAAHPNKSGTNSPKCLISHDVVVTTALMILGISLTVGVLLRFVNKLRLSLVLVRVNRETQRIVEARKRAGLSSNLLIYNAIFVHEMKHQSNLCSPYYKKSELRCQLTAAFKDQKMIEDMPKISDLIGSYFQLNGMVETPKLGFVSRERFKQEDGPKDSHIYANEPAFDPRSSGAYEQTVPKDKRKASYIKMGRSLQFAFQRTNFKNASLSKKASQSNIKNFAETTKLFEKSVAMSVLISKATSSPQSMKSGTKKGKFKMIQTLG